MPANSATIAAMRFALAPGAILVAAVLGAAAQSPATVKTMRVEFTRADEFCEVGKRAISSVIDTYVR